jgi:hypothetical protein
MDWSSSLDCFLKVQQERRMPLALEMAGKMLLSYIDSYVQTSMTVWVIGR